MQQFFRRNVIIITKVLAIHIPHPGAMKRKRLHTPFYMVTSGFLLSVAPAVKSTVWKRKGDHILIVKGFLRKLLQCKVYQAFRIEQPWGKVLRFPFSYFIIQSSQQHEKN